MNGNAAQQQFKVPADYRLCPACDLYWRVLADGRLMVHFLDRHEPPCEMLRTRTCAGCHHGGPHLPTTSEHTPYKAFGQCRVPFCLCPADQSLVANDDLGAEAGRG